MRKNLGFEFEFKASVVGLVSSITNYRIAHFLNEGLRLNLERIDDHEVFKQQDSIVHAYPKFYYFDELNKREYYLIQNNLNKNYCLPELKQFDYLYLSPIPIHQEVLKQEILTLKNISEIEFVLEIKNELIKNKQNIFLDANTF